MINEIYDNKPYKSYRLGFRGMINDIYSKEPPKNRKGKYYGSSINIDPS